MNYSIIGFDPGLRSTGWAIVKIKNNKYDLSKYSTITTKSNCDLDTRIQYLYRESYKILLENQVNFIALESGYCGICGQSTLKLGMVRGAIISACAPHKVYMYPPATIKQQIANKGNAKKDVLKDSLKNYFSIKQIEDINSYDITDAIAVALTHIKIASISNM